MSLKSPGCFVQQNICPGGQTFDLLARLGLALHLEWLGDVSARFEIGRPAAGSDSSALLPAATRLTMTELQHLLNTARRGEIATLRQRLDELRGDPLADSLLTLAKNYKMERIREVLEESLSSTPGA